MATKEKRRARRSLKGSIAGAKKDASTKDLPKKQRKRKAAALGRKLFRKDEADRKAREAAKPKKAEAAPAEGEKKA